MPVVYISIQSWHLNYFKSISVTCDTKKMYALVSDTVPVTYKTKNRPHLPYGSLDRLLGKLRFEQYNVDTNNCGRLK